MQQATPTAIDARDPQERRRYARRRDAYKVWCALGTKWVSAHGVDISASGLGLVVPVEIQKGEVQLRASLDEQYVVLRARTVWAQPGTYRGQIVHRYGLKITGIAADDWDTLVRYCSNEQSANTTRAMKLGPDDVARLIPRAVQHRMLGMLAERKRLAPLDGKTPLVQYSYSGTAEREGIVLHRVAIHSRIFDGASMETQAFDTRFTYSDDSRIVRMDE